MSIAQCKAARRRMKNEKRYKPAKGKRARRNEFLKKKLAAIGSKRSVGFQS